MQSVDIVLRTTLGSVFGFMTSTVWNTKPKKVPKSQQNDGSIKIEQGKSDLDNTTFSIFKIGVVSCICFYCLIMLIVVRNIDYFYNFDNSSIATLTQFRDFISAGVGALIGLSRDKS